MMSSEMEPAETYRAYVVRETPEGFSGRTESLPLSGLPDHDLLIRVHYSSLNYKDALSATGHRGITSRYPHTPGIDAAGEVVRSTDPRFREGTPVIVTGRDLGMNTPGGFGEYVRVPAAWAIPLPAGLTLKESMVFGTAGFTAASGVLKLLRAGIRPEQEPVVVTGATGGTGSMAVSILSRLGYTVTAVSGKPGSHSWLRELGSAEIIDRNSFLDQPDRPLLKSRWSGGIDTVGGEMLDRLLRQTRSGGCIACCGNVAGNELKTSVFPFILRGITLTGIDSANVGQESAKKIWQHLSTDWKPEKLSSLYREIPLEQIDGEIQRILRGEQTGRVIINLLALQSDPSGSHPDSPS